MAAEVNAQLSDVRGPRPRPQIKEKVYTIALSRKGSRGPNPNPNPNPNQVYTIALSRKGTKEDSATRGKVGRPCCLPRTTCYLPPATYASLLTAYCSRLTPHSSILTPHDSLLSRLTTLTTHCSHHSLLSTVYKVGRPSTFTKDESDRLFDMRDRQVHAHLLVRAVRVGVRPAGTRAPLG